MLTRTLPTIVLVDDETLRDVLCELFVAEGHRVLTAPDGLTALGMIRSIGSDCVVLVDLFMPDIDGYEFRRRQLADPVLARLPTIVMTGAACVRHEDLRAPVVSKPFDCDALLATIERVSRQPLG